MTKPIKDKDIEGVFIDEAEGEVLEEGYLEFADEASANAQLEIIDKALGYLVEDGEGGWTRPFQTKTAMRIIKHPNQEQWALDIRQVHGTKYKKEGSKILEKVQKDAMKKKAKMKEDGWFDE